MAANGEFGPSVFDEKVAVDEAAVATRVGSLLSASVAGVRTR